MVAELAVLLDKEAGVEPEGPDAGDGAAAAVGAEDDLAAVGLERAVREMEVRGDDGAAAVVGEAGHTPGLEAQAQRGVGGAALGEELQAGVDLRQRVLAALVVFGPVAAQRIAAMGKGHAGEAAARGHVE